MVEERKTAASAMRAGRGEAPATRGTMGRRGDARGARGLRRRRAQCEEEAPATRAGREGGDGDTRGVKEKRRRRSIWRRSPPPDLAPPRLDPALPLPDLS
uniref:Uncharacterized protein n=1 Tax=Oryza glumipatula TaxID=40148 RepID=A0A0D9YVP5_9ORYZ